MPAKLSRFVGVRFTPDDYRQLEQKAEGLGTNVSGLLRAAAFRRLPAACHRRLVDRELINQLSRLGNNLNQQTRLFHQLRYRGQLPEAAAVLELLAEVQDLLEVVSRAVAEVST